ncbi:MAG: XRE family transcriptional regulator [Paludibacter sp.]|nr:XRE family transcriptional regulator [Paludibacter sp.]
MDKKFIEVTEIQSAELYNQVSEYTDALIDEATTAGALSEQDADNDYTREIGRLGRMCADYESLYMKFEKLKFKSPLVVSIENEMEKRHIKQRQTAILLDVKESTFSQIMTGKRSVSMRMAKRLYKELNIDPGLILEFS